MLALCESFHSVLNLVRPPCNYHQSKLFFPPHFICEYCPFLSPFGLWLFVFGPISPAYFISANCDNCFYLVNLFRQICCYLESYSNCLKSSWQTLFLLFLWRFWMCHRATEPWFAIWMILPVSSFVRADASSASSNGYPDLVCYSWIAWNSYTDS